jgi:glucose-1-phosphate adenylyltransferase
MKVLTLILAGGRGERLYPLTRDRAKPAVPFGGIYRIIDFTLTNCLHSGMKQILILTQYRSFSLEKHIQLGWNILCTKLGEFVHVVSAQQRVDELWYQGTADAVYQNLYILQQIRPDLVLILSGDHLYKMDYRPMIAFHLEHGADLTVAALPQPKELSTQLGVLEIDENCRVLSFQEKPQQPKCMPDDPDSILASMGIYVFDTRKMVRRLVEDAKSDSQHDFGRDVIPRMVASGDRVYSYVFWDPQTRTPKYWRDVGTIDSFFDAHMDLLGQNPVFDISDPSWPILTYEAPAPPARILPIGDGVKGKISDSIISNGCTVQASLLVRSVLSPNVVVEEGAEVEECILMEGVRIGKGAKLKRVIMDKRASVLANRVLRCDEVSDKGFLTLSKGGVVVVPADSVVE